MRQALDTPMATIRQYWKTFPRRSLILFPLGVFFIFSTIGFVNDIMNLGREPVIRFVLNVLLSGIFPVFYAISPCTSHL